MRYNKLWHVKVKAKRKKAAKSQNANRKKCPVKFIVGHDIIVKG